MANQPKKHPGGRPTTYTIKLATEILIEVSEGKSVRQIVDSKDMPAMSTIFRWLDAHKEFQEQYARAKQMAADAMAEDMLNIADKALPDRDSVAKAKLQVETRQWIASKLKPKKYGEKLDVTSAGDKLEVAPLVVSKVKPRKDADAKAKAEASS